MKMCAAFGHVCKKCGKSHHFEKCCRPRPAGPRASTHYVEEVAPSADAAEEFYVYNVTGPNTKKIIAEVEINSTKMRAQLDTGSTCNLMTANTYVELTGDTKLSKLDPCGSTLCMWNNDQESSIGKVKLPLGTSAQVQPVMAEFVIAQRGSSLPLLSCNTCVALGLITVNVDNCALVQEMDNVAHVSGDIVAKYPGVFKGTGKFPGVLSFKVDHSVTPVQLPVRRIPLGIRDDVKQELDRLVAEDILIKEEEPTDWISCLLLNKKRSGKWRVCLDPVPLNRALLRNHYVMPTLDDLLPELSKARVFSVVDARNGFWHVCLDEQSSKLTTFGTPWGRYRWLRLPFGVSVAPEEFQRRLDIALEGLRGVKAINDDILVWGNGDTDEEADRDHDRNMEALLQRCLDRGVRMNKEKVQYKRREITFHGHELSAAGLKPDPTKVQAIADMPAPEDKEGVRRILGTINYLRKFAPNLSTLSEPLRDLTKADREFV
jgi:hypothetical protein